MSQAKVEHYKKEKANRKKIIAREKRKHVAAIILGWAVCIAIVGWASYSGYHYYESKKPVKSFYAATSDLDTYINGLGSAE